MQMFNKSAHTALHVVPGVSHAYMNVTGLLPEAKEVRYSPMKVTSH